MKDQLLDYDMSFDNVPILYDNSWAISLLKYIVHHSKTKHININKSKCIDLKYHFIKDHVEHDYFAIEFIDIENQLAGIFKK